jgi:uncharacterized protein (TIGR00251 family)
VTIELQPHDDGVVLPVRAQPGARSSGIRGAQDGALKVSVTQIAEKGKANKALIAVLSKHLQLRKSQITLLSGPTSAQKRFLIRDMSAAQLRRRIEPLLAE